VRTQEEFERFLTETIAPRLRDLERERAAVAARREAARLPASWKIGAAAAGVVLGAIAQSFEAVVCVAALPWFADVVRMSKVRDTASPRLRAELLEPVVEFWDPSFRYAQGGCIAEEEFAASRLFATGAWNLYGGEDLVVGRHGETAFRFSELHVRRRKQSGKRTEVETVFRGLLFVADFNKAFRGQTLVLPDRAERRLGAVGRALQSVAGGGLGDLALVELEDAEFERAFVVRSTDANEARYLLSPSLMRRMLAFHENTGSQLRLSFTAGRLYVAIPLAHDLFEIPLHAPVDLTILRRWGGELLFATSVVDELDLNTRIWSKVGVA
jgi:hypothetical protein